MPTLARAETRAQQLEWERTRLTLRVQDLEQQLATRSRGALPAPDAATLSYFHDDAASPDSGGPAAVSPRAPPRAPKRPTVAAARRPGRKPLDPSLPREVIRLTDPPEAHRVDVFTGKPLMPGFRETLEVLARKPAVYFVKRYERTVWVSPAKTAPLATPWPASALPPGPRIIGLDEVSVRRGHTYRIVVSDLVRQRPIWFGGQDRSEASLDEFFAWLGARKSHRIRLAVMDMWKAFGNSTTRNAPNAKILFDKFHVLRHLSDALDTVRKREYARLRIGGLSKARSTRSSRIART
jgi:hypothetical protein